MKKLIFITIAIITLSSCGKDYIVRSVDTNNLIYMNGNDIGNEHKVGDTIRTFGNQRIDSANVATVCFTGVIITAEKKD